MKLYFAPLEGITTCTYRNTHAGMFDGCDEYYAPFINPSDQERVSRKGLRDILPERNSDVSLKIQVLTNKAESFLKFEDKVRELGYDEININIGCPAATVVRKGRGSGFLRDPVSMYRFFSEIFEKSSMRISVKTRIGYDSGDEMEDLMRIYNKYPMSLLIIHPRAREDFYNGEPNYEVFSASYATSTNKLCYNGNVFTEEDYRRITTQFPDLDSVMLGRGAIRNPALFREIRGGAPLTTAELVEFSERLAANYNEVLTSETFTLHKLKEIWVYMMQNFPEEKKIAKTIKKANTLTDFMAAIHRLPEL